MNKKLIYVMTIGADYEGETIVYVGSDRQKGLDILARNTYGDYRMEYRWRDGEEVGSREV